MGNPYQKCGRDAVESEAGCGSSLPIILPFRHNGISQLLAMTQINSEFNQFVKRVQEVWEKKDYSDLQLEFDIPSGSWASMAHLSSQV